MPTFKLKFDRMSEITDVENIGKIKNAFVRDELNQAFGRRKWTYKKGSATVRLHHNQQIWLVELHFYEAQGTDPQREAIKYLIKRIYE